MNRTTSLLLTSLSMNCSMAMCSRPQDPVLGGGIRPALPIYVAQIALPPQGARAVVKAGLPCPSGALRSRRLKRQRVQNTAHLALERLIDELELLHPRLALERSRPDR